MEEDDSLYLQLHKLTAAAAVNSEEGLDHILTTLWKTRRTGLRPTQKSHFQSLLNLPSLPELDPVLACLRSLIRKCVHDNFTGDDLLKLFPPDLSLDLQSDLVLLLQKYQNQWKEEISKEQQLPRSSISFQARTSAPSSFTSSDISALLWSREGDPNGRFNCNDLLTSAPVMADTPASHFGPVTIQQSVGPTDNLGIIPRLKSMTWKMKNRNSAPDNRVAIISLKLEDYTNSPSGETEVKFQLNRDTLEAMLRSMTYINDQLPSVVGTSSGPAQKKQKQ